MNDGVDRNYELCLHEVTIAPKRKGEPFEKRRCQNRGAVEGYCWMHSTTREERLEKRMQREIDYWRARAMAAEARVAELDPPEPLSDDEARAMFGLPT